MGFSYAIGGMIPFTILWGVSLISYAVNGIRGAAALPLSIPAAPRGNRCFALRSPPTCLTAAGSTRLARPYGTRSMPRFASVRHPWRPDLVIPASVRRFQRGHNTLAAISQIKATQVSLKARFCRPDKAKPPSGNCAAVIMPDGATLIRPTPFQHPCTRRPDKQRYIPAIGA